MKRRRRWFLAGAGGALAVLSLLGFLLVRDEPLGPALSNSAASLRSPATGPLRVHPKNPRYFADASGRAIYLTGSHTWNNVQEISNFKSFSFDDYIRFLRKANHNFTRLWAIENASWEIATTNKVSTHPMPFRRTGTSTALDGRSKFILTEFEPEYFDRLRSRVIAARNSGIYVSVMLFNGWSTGKKPTLPGNSWLGHPFHRDNNVNGVDGDANGDSEGIEIHTLQNPAITTLQEKYVRKVIDTLNDLDNVLWEISNESDGESTDWQYHMIGFIKSYEGTKPAQHPVGMTVPYPGGSNADLFASPADWISPLTSKADPYQDDPPAADGKKVVISDTDHLWGIGGNRAWVWKSFTRGLNPVFMDPMEERTWDALQNTMGRTLVFAEQMNLAAVTPRSDLASSGYCLAEVGEDYLIYIPLDAPALESARFIHRFKRQIRNFRRNFQLSVTVDLKTAPGRFTTEWFNPFNGDSKTGEPIEGGTSVRLTAPFKGDAVLRLKKANAPFDSTR
jgi:hypothetical protein